MNKFPLRRYAVCFLAFAAYALASTAHAQASEYRIECSDLSLPGLKSILIDQVGEYEYRGMLTRTDGSTQVIEVPGDQVAKIYSSAPDNLGMDLGPYLGTPELHHDFYLRFDGKSHHVDAYFTNPGTFQTSREYSTDCSKNAVLGVDDQR